MFASNTDTVFAINKTLSTCGTIPTKIPNRIEANILGSETLERFHVRYCSSHRTNAKRHKIPINATIPMHRVENRFLKRNYSCDKDCRSVGLVQAASKATS
jgi:hypothetical protein